MKGNSVLFVGCGDLGVRTGALLLGAGARVAGMRRNPARLPAGFASFAGDYAEPGSLDFIGQLQPDYVVATFNPSDRSVAGYQRGFAAATANLLAALGSYSPAAVISVSSTRVFAERDGGWVDEASALARDEPRAAAMLAAEQQLLDSGQRATVVRFAGIYGFPGGRLLERIRRGQLCAAQPLRYSNRIHRDDCGGFLLHLLQLAASGQTLAPVYVGVDDLPAPQFEVESWLAAQMGVPILAGEQPAQARESAGHKRCSNRLLHASGYQLRYPDYRAGYGAVLADGI